MSHSLRPVRSINDHLLGRALLACSLCMAGAAPLWAMPPKAASEQNQEPKPMARDYGTGIPGSTGPERQVLRLSVPEDRSFGHEEGKEEAPVAPTLAGLGSDTFVSASVLAQKAKQFDDGLYAAVELAAQQGAGRFPGKAALLRSLAKALTGQPGQPASSAPATILAAGKLGGLGVNLPAAVQPPVQQAIDEFLGNELRSKPISFYTWSGDLSAIFQQDRMLQTELTDKAGTEAIVKALHADQQARSIYEAYLRRFPA